MSLIKKMKYKIKSKLSTREWFSVFLKPATVKNNSFWIFISVFILIGTLISILKNRVVDEFWLGVLVEATGFLFDIFLFGIVYTIYDTISNKKNLIKSYRNEISFFRNWNSKEASYRILGNIKLLNELLITEINLEYCHLSNVRIDNINLTKAKLSNADFENSLIENVNFENSNLYGVSFKNATLENCSLLNTKLLLTNFNNTQFRNVKVDDENWIENKKMNMGYENLNTNYEISKLKKDSKIVYILNPNDRYKEVLKQEIVTEIQKTKDNKV